MKSGEKIRCPGYDMFKLHIRELPVSVYVSFLNDFLHNLLTVLWGQFLAGEKDQRIVQVLGPDMLVIVEIYNSNFTRP